jgi:predicted Rdx family selenoprotein
MRMNELIPNQPIAVQKSRRNARGRVLTSGDAGKILPLKYEWLHREDGVQSGKIRVNAEMAQTAELLNNGVGMTVYCHFVPMLAFDRFNSSMDELNRSYKGENGAAGSVVPFFQSNRYYHSTADGVNAMAGEQADGVNPGGSVLSHLSTQGVTQFYQTMGIHTQASQLNTTVVEAYNAIVNMRRKARSKSLPLRNAFDHSLAEAFWINNGMQNIVPDFDQSLIDGQVSLSGLTFQAPITAPLGGNSGADYSLGTTHPTRMGPEGSATWDAAEAKYTWDNVFAELTTGGNATMSLADIEQARKTAAFAKLRSMYDGVDDEHIIDLLMSGIRVPDEALKQPILLGRQRAMMGFNQRYATDGGNLDDSATNGYATIDMNIRTPGAMNTGGVIMLTAEICPEQLWERRKDYFLYTTDADKLPNYLRDVLDPEKVAVVKNDHADVNHSTPDGTFGYAPLNHEWLNKDMVNVGGKYYRPADDAFDEDRQKIWTAEATDVSLNEDFYLVSELHKKVFSDQVSDSFEITALTDFNIVGNTVFGAGLHESDATSDYDVITAQVDETRIDK